MIFTITLSCLDEDAFESSTFTFHMSLRILSFVLTKKKRKVLCYVWWWKKWIKFLSFNQGRNWNYEEKIIYDFFRFGWKPIPSITAASFELLWDRMHKKTNLNICKSKSYLQHKTLCWYIKNLKVNMILFCSSAYRNLVNRWARNSSSSRFYLENRTMIH